MATAVTSAAVAVVATTQGQGKITSAVVMVKVDMVVAATEAAMASRVAMATDRVDMEAMVVAMEAMVVAMEEMEEDTQEVDMVVVVVEEVEGGIRNHETG